MSNRSRRVPSKPRSPRPKPDRSVVLLLIAGPLIGLGLGLWLLGSVWPVDPDTESAYIYGGVGGFFSGLLGAAAMAGSIVMAPTKLLAWLSPVAGALFGVGFLGLVLAGMKSESAPWALIGVVGIAACVVWFYVLGMISGYIPPLFVNRYGTWTAPVVGLITAIVGISTGILEALVIGVLTIAAWLGILIGSLAMRRRSDDEGLHVS